MIPIHWVLWNVPKKMEVQFILLHNFFVSVEMLRFSSRRKKCTKSIKSSPSWVTRGHLGHFRCRSLGQVQHLSRFPKRNDPGKVLSQEGGEGEKSPPIQSVAKWCKSMLEIMTLCLWRCFHLDKWIVHQNRDYLEKDPTLAMEATPRVATNCSIPEFSRLQSCPVEILKGIHPDTKCGEYGVIKKHLGHDKRTGEGSMATEDSQGSRSRSWQKVN